MGEHVKENVCVCVETCRRMACSIFPPEALYFNSERQNGAELVSSRSKTAFSASFRGENFKDVSCDGCSSFRYLRGRVSLFSRCDGADSVLSREVKGRGGAAET